ncbi:MAG: PD-(D/E)XK nuclease family protein [Mesorhizobium sp.]|nr:MAG: PD-(D/E)XK nuclease family protein [Mesorhizobium sp.]
MNRRTVVVEGPLAFRMRRIASARRGETGVQIMNIPQMAARLAGGFTRPAQSQDLDPAIRDALEAGGFAELESIRHLPGMTRAVARTLAKIWHADLPLLERADQGGRLADIAEIERRVRANLPKGVLTARDLREAALMRLENAPAVLGSVELDGVVSVAPVWRRPLLQALNGVVPLAWHNPGAMDINWFPGEITTDQRPTAGAMEVVSCANPRAEVVEALRWMRELIASGRAKPEDIAICATSVGEWDEHFLVLAADADLPLHFSHGVPALASREGQACGALADVLLNGLSQDRVRRLFSHAAGRSRALQDLPRSWALGLQAGAALFELDQWLRALDVASGLRTDGVDPRPILTPVLELLAQGPDAAEQAGVMLLETPARSLWREALRRAPPEALEFSLQELRLPDGRDAGACAVWCPANHLAAAPRPWVRLLGVTTRSWPRRVAEDPLIPRHVLSHGILDPEPVTTQDRRAYQIITARAYGGCVLSRSRRNAQGGLLSASPLIAQGAGVKALKRARIPSHAFSEADRLLARADDAATSPALTAAYACWRDWRSPAITAHDGRVRADHPVIARVIGRIQSATSLRLMLRDPLAFVWRYALDWRSVAEDDQPLTLDARAYGDLVHELLKRTVDELEPRPGYSRAARHEIDAALTEAVTTVSTEWPLKRSVPPLLLWRHTVDAAAQLALRALTLDEAFQPGTRSWTELTFGDTDGAVAAAGDLPWDPTTPVEIIGTKARVKGSIDRLDLTAAGNAVRVSDYKTGVEPKRADQIVLGGGAELQRVIYAMAARQLLPDNPRVVARLIYLGNAEPRVYKLPDVDQAIAEIAAHVTAASILLRQGRALPGPDARENWNDFRLALPASPTVYFQVKQAALSRAFDDFARVWSCR